MPVSYPSDFPQPLLAGFQATVDMGVIATDIPNLQAQRRVHKTMPHAFSLSFMIELTQWATWAQWVEDNGYTWFLMNLPTLYAGLAGTKTSAVLIRFTGDLPAAPRSFRVFQVNVMAEIAPSMIKLFLAAT